MTRKQHQLRKIQLHPFARLFPRADPADRKRLRDDIAKHGILVPGLMYEGKLLDGANRLDIARELGIDFPTEDFNGTAIEAIYRVESLNLCRRHLSPSQKAAAAVDLMNALMRTEGIPKEEAKEIAEEITKAAPSTIDRAERIMASDKTAAKELRNGTATVGGIIGRPDPSKPKCVCPNCGYEWEESA